MIQSLIQTSIAKIGLNGTCAAFGVAGLAGGFILYPITIKTIELAKKLFNKIQKFFEEKNFSARVKSLFSHKCTPLSIGHENLNFFTGEKITTVTKEVVFIPKKEDEKELLNKKVLPSNPTPTEIKGLVESLPPSYES